MSPATGSTFDRILDEYRAGVTADINRTYDMIVRMMTPEEREAAKARRAEMDARTDEVSIEDVRVGDELYVTWPGDVEGDSAGWEWVAGVYALGPHTFAGHHIVLVALDQGDEHRMGPVYERGEIVRRRRPA